MSIEMEVKTSRGTIKNLGKIIQDWADAYQNEHGIQIIVESDSPDWYYIFGKGSIRGFSLRPSSSLFKGGEIQVRLSVMASPADWCFCYSLFSFLAATHAAKIFDENGARIIPIDLTETKAYERSQKAIPANLRFLKHMLVKQNEPSIQLPNPCFDLVITQADLDSWGEAGGNLWNTDNPLIKRAAQLGLCRHAGSILLKSGLTLSAVWFDPVIYIQTDYAVLVKKNSVDLPFDQADLSFVKFEDFLDVFQSKVEKVKENPARYYFPGIDLNNSQDLELYEKLLQMGQDEQPSA